MTLSTPTEVYLGRTARNEIVFADVCIEPASPLPTTVTFTDHTTGPRPAEIAISFSLIQAYKTESANKGKRAEDFPDSRWLSVGQVPPRERILIGALDPAVRVVEDAWKRHHLNLTNAACDHMTEEMLTPSDEVLDAYIAAEVAKRGEWREKYSPAFYGRSDALQKWRLDNVTCPVTGYRWGQAWLAKKVDDAIVDALRAAVAHLPKAVR